MKRCRATELSLFRETQTVNPQQKRYGGEKPASEPGGRKSGHRPCVPHRAEADTFEEKIKAMIEAKKTLAGMTVESGENWIGDITNNELEEIFTLQNH